MEVLNKTKIVLCWELFEARVPKRHIAKRLDVHWETIGLWISGIRKFGLSEYLDRYDKAKKGPRVKRQVDPILKRWVWEIREREQDCCGQKILYFLEREHKTRISIPKIYEILKEKYVVKSKWKKNKKRGPVPKAHKPREVVQIDTVDFGEVFAFTSIDIFSKEPDVILRPALTAQDGVIFLDTAMQRRYNNHSDLIQADGGSEWKDEFRTKVYTYTDRFRVARPYMKNEQSYIESFNRSLRKECLGWGKYRANQIPYLTGVVEEFIERFLYHRPHISLGMRPPLEKT